MRNEVNVNGAAVTIPMEAIESVNARFVNTLYGFISDRLAFPLVENYVKNTWAKYANTILKKDEIKRVPVWVKMHHVPIVAYYDVGLSLISTQIGKPLMLDSYTSNMCLNSWGRSAYARVLIEIAADVELVESLIIAMPMGNKEGHTFAMIDIEYEWTPPRCASCRFFDHVSEKCPKLPKVALNEKVIEEGFIEVKKKKTKTKKKSKKQVEGVRLNKHTLNLQYRRVDKGKSSKINNGVVNKVSTDKGHINNSFSALSEETDTNLKDKERVNADYQTLVESQFLNDSDEDVDEYITIEETSKAVHKVGMNLFPKQNEVRQVIYDNKLSVCAILESHVATRNLERLCKHAFKNWNWFSNAMSCLKGTRIIVGWNQNDVDVAVIHQDPQKPKGKDGILRKLDRVLANLEFLDVFMGTHAVFKPCRISDHSPAVLSIPSLVKKLKVLKKPIRKLMYDKGNLHVNVVRLREELDKVQTDLDNDSSNLNLREKEAVTDFNEALLMEEKIDVVTDAYGNVHHSTEVAKAFINHYEIFLGQPGPNGFTAAFFKDTWDIIGVDVIKAVKEFFTNGRLLKELNHTIIALIPKVNSPARVTDYRPISCCNVLFKCISKIIANRLKDSLKRLVSPNQSAFMPGRCISDNILLTQEIMHNYHLDRGVLRYAFKVDIQNAYNTVDWDFLRVILIGFGFHERMIAWIMECVTTTSFSISVNGLLHGYFEGKRGLRQGDPLSPYLFTLIMEVFTLMLKRRVSETSTFTYHRFCSELDLINLCFADDLFLFIHGDVNSAKVIKDALDDFKDALGLNPSMPKSKAYFYKVINYTKLAILNILPFEEDRLPVKYLGVPLVSSWLISRDSYTNANDANMNDLQFKLDNFQKNQQDFQEKFEQMQDDLLNQMRSFMQNLYNGPSGVDKEPEATTDTKLPSTKDIQPLPVQEPPQYSDFQQPAERESRSIQSLQNFKVVHNSSISSNTSQIFSIHSIAPILSTKEPEHLLSMGYEHPNITPETKSDEVTESNDENLLPIPNYDNDFEDIEYIEASLFDPEIVSVEEENSVEAENVVQQEEEDIDLEDISQIQDNVLREKLLSITHLISNIESLNDNSTPDRKCDKVVWKSGNGRHLDFSVSKVWEDIRMGGALVSWSNLVWFSQYIPRHSFVLWLVIHGKLKTHDNMSHGDRNVSLLCIFCGMVPDSHDHLFFDCNFPKSIWGNLKKHGEA
nr:hypothetical protein [Tanacetum cinerariifolium]